MSNIPEWIKQCQEKRAECRQSGGYPGGSDLGVDFSDTDLWVQRAAEVLSYSFEELGSNPISMNSWIQLRLVKRGQITDREFQARVRELSGTDAFQLFFKSVGADYVDLNQEPEEAIRLAAQKVRLELSLSQES